jgi:type II secretory pathway pseudopilin PulG
MRTTPAARPMWRHGYALPWIILTVAIIAALAAVVAPALTTLDDRARAQSSATRLKLIATGFVQFGVTINQYPGRVSQLALQLTTSDKNTCGQSMTSGDVTQWTGGAPFAPIYTATNGTWTDIGRIRDSVPFRSSPPVKTPIYVELPGVSGEDAAMLKNVVDNGTGDTVSFAAAVNDTTTVRYRVVSSGVIINNRC